MVTRTCGTGVKAGWFCLLLAVLVMFSALPAAASSSGIYVSTADSLGGGANRMTEVAFGDYSTTGIYQGAGVNKPYAVALDTTAAKLFTVLNDAVGQRVVAMDLNNGGTAAIAATETSGAGRAISGLALDLTDKVVYFATAASLVATDNKIQRVNYDGTGLTTVYSSGGNSRKPMDLAVDHNNGKLFIVFSDGAASWIAVAGLDGSGLAEVPGTRTSTGGIAIGGIVLDTLNSYLYYTVAGSLASENNRIQRSKYDGSDLKLLYSGNLYDKPSFLALDQSNNIYAAFTGSGYQMVKSASLANPASMVWSPVPNTLVSATGVSITGIAAPAAQLSATTGAASAISATAATLNGTVNANGTSASVSFEYGADTNYGILVAASPSTVTGATETAVSATISGLTCNTPYHFRVKAEGSSGAVFGNDQSFTTSACPTYTVTYDGNGSTGGSVPSDSSAYLFDATVTVSGNTGALERTGYTFTGWNTAANGSGTAYAAAATFRIAGNTTLYAQWTLDTCVTPPPGLVSWWKGEGNADDSAGSNNGTIHNIATVKEGNTATASCSNGAVITSYSSLYGAGSTMISCGTCTIGAASCSVTFNNTNCTDPVVGTPKTGKLNLVCVAPDSTGFVAGKAGKALAFDGIGDYVAQGATYKGSVASTSSSSFTMEFWAKPTATITNMPLTQTTSGYAGVSGQRYAIFPENLNNTSEAGVGISVGTNGIVVVEHSYDYAPAPLVYPLASGDIPADGWLHIALIYENLTPKLYVNGVLKQTGLSSGRTVYPSSAFGEAGLGFGYYQGYLDEVHIFNRALTATEIQGIYTAASAGLCVPPLPTVTAVSPADGATDGGIQVTITGTGFTGATSVMFGSTGATTYTVDSDTQITVISPAAVAGTVHITVTTPGGTSAAVSADQFTYIVVPTIVVPFAPLGADNSAGTGFATLGAMFKASNGTFYYNGRVTPNAGVPDTFVATIKAEGGAACKTFTFRDITFGSYFDNLFFGMLQITLYDINNVQIGNPILFQMSGDDTTYHYINGATLSSIYARTPWSIDNVASMEIVFNLYGIDNGEPYPATAQSIYFDSITIANVVTAPLPAVTAISPSSGPAAGGTQVIITGTGFTGATAVKFANKDAAGFTVNSATQITAVSPANVVGLVADIMVTTPGGTSATNNADRFTYTQDQARNFTTGTSYATLETALAEALAGAEIRAYESQFDGYFILDKGITLKGGFDATFLVSGTTPTVLNGGLTVRSGTSTVKTVVVKGKLAVQGGSLRANDVTVHP